MIGRDIHRTFARVVFGLDGQLRWDGQIERRSVARVIGLGRSFTKDDEVVL